MDDCSVDIVTFALALHLEADPDSIHLDQRLADDLGLDALDLVLVALRLEEIAEAEFPVAALETARTVADLAVIVRLWCEVEGRDRPTLDAVPPSHRHDSSIRLAAEAPSRRFAANER